jgi:Glu-tRNA(Gln) amidotransferase subunit E-like FAD-binding protein
VLLESYFSTNAVNTRLSEHPLLKDLTNRTDEKEHIRNAVIEIITNSPLMNKTPGVDALVTSYFGKLMKEMRGKIDVDLAKDIIKEEIAERLEIIPGKGKYSKVKFRSKYENNERA